MLQKCWGGYAVAELHNNAKILINTDVDNDIDSKVFSSSRRRLLRRRGRLMWT